MTTEAEARLIAKGLTKAQVRMLNSLPRVYGQWWKPTLALQAAGLIEELRRSGPKGWCYDRALWGCSPRGLAVRRVLEAEASSGSAVSHQQGVE